MSESSPIYVLPCDGNPEFMEVPRKEWCARFDWTFSCNRKIEVPYVTEDREVRMLTALYAEDLEFSNGLPPVNPVVPSLRGTVVLSSYLISCRTGRDLQLDVRQLYGKNGIKDLLRKPWLDVNRDPVPCNMNYLRRKICELESMPLQG
ncbi:hypothetical protein ABBQ38_010802 [Trebouxia sp. C0009 RCD-2024]